MHSVIVPYETEHMAIENLGDIISGAVADARESDTLPEAEVSEGGDEGDVTADEAPDEEADAEGKEHALAVGTMRLSTDDVRTVNKGVAIEALHFQGDDLFKITVME